jgi:cytochrome P450
MTTGNCRHREFSITSSPIGCEVTINSADTARALFLKQTHHRYRPLAALLRSVFRHRVMIVADGEDWERTHGAINPYLHAALVASDYAPVIEKVAKNIFGALAARSASASPAPILIDVETLMRVVITSFMGHLLFGAALPLNEAEYLEERLSAASQPVRGRGITVVNTVIAVLLRVVNRSEAQRVIFPKKQRHAIADLLRWIDAKIDATQCRGVKPPLLESLALRYAHEEPVRQRRAIVAEYGMLCIAGIDTTAATLAFAIAEIASNEDVRETVSAEARQRQPGVSRYDALTIRYPSIYRVLRETLWRYTIVPVVMREAVADQQIRGTRCGTSVEALVTVKRGAVLRYLALQGNMRQSIWGQPRRFDPDRFAQPLTPEQKKNHHTFGLGPQSCPGRALAIAESILVLAAFFEYLAIEHKELKQTIPFACNGLSIRPLAVTAIVRAVVPGSIKETAHADG